MTNVLRGEFSGGREHKGLSFLDGGSFRIPACARVCLPHNPPKTTTMFSHVVIFWADPDKPDAADELVAGAKKYLTSIPGVLQFHVGRMAPSHRRVVDQTYQIALNITFPDKQAQDAYQTHPQHLEFVERVFKPNCMKVVVYDFE
jgi:hypothetical protein